ncbi:MAG: amidohydrolase family protein [Chloroflexi bacterium]|nr:amidohydrolase family protein [Chloroflexota bacterium]
MQSTFRFVNPIGRAVPTSTNPTYTLLTADRVIDAKGDPPIKHGAVLTLGSQIIAVGRASEIRAPNGAPVEHHDYPGATILPGMVDCHTHNNGFGDGRNGQDLAALEDEILTVQAAGNARRSLFSGVTTIRENGPKNTTMFHLRDAVNEGLTLGPRMILCGRPISIIGGHMGYFGGEVTGENECRAMARQLIKEGADYLKITATGGSTPSSFPLRPAFNVDELRAITDEAHKFGKLTATHSTATQGVINSLDADVDMIIHCVYKEPDDTDNFRVDVAERIGEQGAYVNPTLHVGRSKIWSLTQKQRDFGINDRELAELDNAKQELEARLDQNRRMIELGVKVITGSDSSWGDYQLGNTVYETELLVDAGYSHMQGVLSVTKWASEALGVDDIVGTLEPGKQADILVVDGDPSKDVNDLWNVVDVFLRGEKLDRGSEESLEAVRQTPEPF